jgi:hypothetical protein
VHTDAIKLKRAQVCKSVKLAGDFGKDYRKLHLGVFRLVDEEPTSLILLIAGAVMVRLTVDKCTWQPLRCRLTIEIISFASTFQHITLHGFQHFIVNRDVNGERLNISVYCTSHSIVNKSYTLRALVSTRVPYS